MALTVALVFTASLALCYGLLSLIAAPKAQVGRRVEAIAGIEMGTGKRRREAKPRRARSLGWMLQLEEMLHRAEIELPAKEFATRWGLVTLCLSVVLLVVMGPFGPILGVAVSGVATMLYLKARVQRRLKRFNDGMHDMLTTVTNSLRAGHSFVQALQVVAEDMDGPIREELQRILAEMQIGVTTEEAMDRANVRIGSEDFDLVVTAILIQRQVGGNLAEVLEKITETIRERIRIKHEVKALTAQGRLSSNLFMVLPVGVGILIYLMNPVYMAAMFTTRLGIGMLVFAGFGQAIGYFIIRRIVNVEM